MRSLSGDADLGDVFLIPILHQFLIYAPLRSFAALVDGTAALFLRDGLQARQTSWSDRLGSIVEALGSEPEAMPLPRTGELSPAFLGLIPTRACNLACAYCGFQAPADSGQTLDLDLAREAIRWYLGLVRQSGRQTAEIHFFGGEPFCAPEVVLFAYHLARTRAAELGLSVRFEVATNGAMSESRSRWAADNLDSIILSLDGPAEIQDLHRQGHDGAGSYAEADRTARVLSQGSAAFSIRACVTAATVERTPELARWFCQTYQPEAVCFEPVQATEQSTRANLIPPDPWTFARKCVEAARILEARGVMHVYAAADIAARRASFCPVGRDVPILSPGGSIDACYLLRQEWEAKGMDLNLGKMEDGNVKLNSHSVESVRKLNVWNKPLCSGCFCKWHCAGGCHVNHQLPDSTGAYDDLCIQTRIITLRNVLRAMDRDDLAIELLADHPALERAVLQHSDRYDRVRIS